MLLFVKLYVFFYFFGRVSAFQPILRIDLKWSRIRVPMHRSQLLLMRHMNNSRNPLQVYMNRRPLQEDEPEIVFVDSADAGDIPDDLVDEFAAGQPSELSVLKEVR